MKIFSLLLLSMISTNAFSQIIESEKIPFVEVESLLNKNHKNYKHVFKEAYEAGVALHWKSFKIPSLQLVSQPMISYNRDYGPVSVTTYYVGEESVITLREEKVVKNPLVNQLPSKADYRIISDEDVLIEVSRNGCKQKHYSVQFYSLLDSAGKELKRSKNFYKEHFFTKNTCNDVLMQRESSGRVLGVNKSDELEKLFQEAKSQFNR